MITPNISDLRQRQAETHSERPRRYLVLLQNDHFTPGDFVIKVLRTVFSLSEGKSRSIMLEVHNNGSGIAGGPYLCAIADEKVCEVREMASAAGFPLRAITRSME